MIINFIMLLITALLAVKQKSRWAVLFFFLTILVMKFEFYHHASDALNLEF
ncbi:DUF5993 family protein [Francisellaceae bacterium CB300]|jgi:hypothetical protein